MGLTLARMPDVLGLDGRVRLAEDRLVGNAGGMLAPRAAGFWGTV